MKKIMVGVAVALALGISTAAADGIDKRAPSSIAAPVPVHAPSWTGFYIGAGIVAGVLVHDVSVNDAFFEERLFDFGRADTGAFGTVTIGWDWQLGPKAVFGIFADYDFLDLSTRQRFFEDFDHSTSADSAWSVGARLGWLSSPSTLLYLTGGYTQVQLEHRASFFGLDELTVSRDRDLDGWFIGAGIDTRLWASNWFLRLEYRFTEFDTDGLRIADDGFFDMRVDTELEAHTARATLTYKFTSGWGSGFNSWGKY
jgi:outer membrane immunogenic protein